MMSGYWDMPDQTAATITPEGYLRTGELPEHPGVANAVLVGIERDETRAELVPPVAVSR